MKTQLFLLVPLFLAACAAPVKTRLTVLPTPAETLSPANPKEQPTTTATLEPTMNSIYPDFGPAPELAGDTWLNSDRPLRLSNLRGKVVLVDMWTFG